MRVALALWLLVAACRFRFDEMPLDAASFDGASDARPDIPSGHDEDGDAVADELDTCPHDGTVAQVDGDGDGVGDGCDPEPTVARQKIVLFDPHVAPGTWTIKTGAWTHTGDGLACDTSMIFGELIRAFPVQHAVIEIGVDVAERTAASAQHQVSLAVLDDVSSPYYYVEAYESDTSGGYSAVSSYDGNVYGPVSLVSMTSGVHAGPLRLRFSIQPPTPTLGVATAWPGEPYATTIDVPGYAGGPNIGLGAQGVILELEYLIVIATL